MKNNKRVKLVAISVAMMLGAQCAMADSTAINVSDSETLKSVLKQSTVIDYEYFESRLKELRTSSIDFLKKALE